MSNTELRCTGAVAADSVGGRTQQEIAAYRSTRCRVGWGRAVGSTANRWTPPRTVEMCLRIRACVRSFRLHGPRLLPLSACPKASRILASCSDPFCAGRRDYSKHPKSLCRNLASCFLPWPGFLQPGDRRPASCKTPLSRCIHPCSWDASNRITMRLRNAEKVVAVPTRF